MPAPQTAPGVSAVPPPSHELSVVNLGLFLVRLEVFDRSQRRTSVFEAINIGRPKLSRGYLVR